jgi:hypothetical protein
MLNPSTADASRDDATIRRCASFSRAWGFGAMVVVNLFALRATDPRRLREAADPVGPRNDGAIRGAAGGSDAVVAAWGRHGSLRGRDERVLDLLRDHDVRLLGVNADGSPRHPLYLPASTRTRPMRVAVTA